mmetsp:Transcript_57492/g.136740  ORF Transcript_57492/g.136740 Transcript_57492/m.136740 type:complete len:224 (-) Transcript_57492:178-849(-)
MGLVLEDQLLEEEESALVVHLLPNLNAGAPRALGSHHVAVGALEVVDHHLHHKHLLENDPREDLLLHRQLHLEALGVGLGPDERRIDQLHLVEALDALEADREELLALRLARGPRFRRVQVPPARPTALQRDALGDTLRDVHPRPDAVRAHRRWVPHHGRSAVAAENRRLCPWNELLRAPRVEIRERHQCRGIRPRPRIFDRPHPDRWWCRPETAPAEVASST